MNYKTTLRLASIGILASALACATARPFVWSESLSEEASGPEPYRIKIGDELRVAVWNQEPLSGTMTVREDGRITLALIGEVAIAGLAPDAAASQIARRLDGLVVDPKVSVQLVRSPPARISVLGEVRAPGQMELLTEEGVLDAIARSGGLTEFADYDAIYVLRGGVHPARIRFRFSDLTRVNSKAYAFKVRHADIVVVE
jgi:polysaccharide export outer membrane protein